MSLASHHPRFETERAPAPEPTPPLLDIQHLQVDFDSGEQAVRAVDDVSLHVDAGETVCLVGESGCGKSVTALSVGRLVPTPPARYVGGRILLDGQDVLQMKPAQLRSVRGRVVSYVFQDPANSLNPVFRIGWQVQEMLRLHQPAAADDAEVVRLLSLVGIPAPELRMRDYPHQLSGGMQQRVVLAMALASRPRLLIADEPTTALDVTVQAQIIELLRDLKARLGMSMLLITHNLAIVRDLAQRLAVMYAGQIVETGPASTLLDRPLHPYTQALLASIPRLGEGASRLKAISGSVPSPGSYPPGCRFFPRCPTAKPECSEQAPDLVEAKPGHWVRCLYWRDMA